RSKGRCSSTKKRSRPKACARRAAPLGSLTPSPFREQPERQTRPSFSSARSSRSRLGGSGSDSRPGSRVSAWAAVMSRQRFAYARDRPAAAPVSVVAGAASRRERRAYSQLVSAPVLIQLGGGEVIGDSPERRVEILSDHETLNATWSRFGPHREGADLHVHRHHSDLFYVLPG